LAERPCRRPVLTLLGLPAIRGSRCADLRLNFNILDQQGAELVLASTSHSVA